MNNKRTNIIAGILLLFLFTISLVTMSLNALTFDEKAHIPAGYSYLKYRDYRINPEHPPLIKSFSAIPLLFLDLNFPEESENWQQNQGAPQWWVQFDLGDEFIYQSGNNPREMIFWSRIPMILMLVLLGWFIFKWAREIGGNKTGLAALALFSFSPTFIAHGQLVATDVGSALGVVMATYYWLKFLKKPDLKNIIFASLFLGIGLLFKFSLVLLIPFFGIITLIYSLLHSSKDKIRSVSKYLGLSFLIGVIAVVFVIWPVYSFHAQNYPAENLVRDTQVDLAPNPMPPLRDIVFKMSENEVTRSLSQYFRGLLMATQRTGFGNTVYFLGEMSAKGWWYYFPLIYLLKEPVPLHLLSFLIPLLGLFLFLRRRKKPTFSLSLISKYISNNFTFFSFLIFIAIYWTASIVGNLNIGVRHLMPTLPFLYLLIAGGMRKILLKANSQEMKKMLTVFFSACFLWYVTSSLLSFPHYLPYYTDLVGGNQKGYIYAVDSNYDWGQDFYRLTDFINENNIDEIHLDYFGGENPQYWLQDKYHQLEPREITKDPQTEILLKASGEELRGWVAVSVNHLMGGTARPSEGFDQETGYYQWLSEYRPVARAGKSIFIYYID